jgi:crossover junction endodeoxyribonuclease RusA
MIITLPFPDMRLSPNRKNGTHWTVTQKHKKIARETGYNAAILASQGQMLNPDIEYQVNITFYHPTKRKQDIDNMLSAFKATIDGVAKALGIDDKQFNPFVVKKEYRKGFGGTIIEIKQIS